MADRRLLGQSPTEVYLNLNKRIWKHLPSSLKNLPLAQSYGGFLHHLVRSRAARRQFFGTFFFRNRPQLEVIRRLADRQAMGATLRMAVLGCSNGAELYSILWTIRSGRPDLKVIAHAVDISREVLEIARKGAYSLRAPELVQEPIFARIRRDEMQDMFDAGGGRDEVSIKPWLKQGITWHLRDAGSPEILDVLGLQDMVVANNFLCHMNPLDAGRCLRNIGRLVNPGGHLFVSGIDLDVRTKVAMGLGWIPVCDLIEDVHDGDSAVRQDWPWEYWGLEPFNKRRDDRELRYASVFQLFPVTDGRLVRGEVALRGRPDTRPPSRDALRLVRGSGYGPSELDTR